MAFEIVRNDITNMKVSAIVNTANPYPVVGSGTESAIYRKAGPELLEARKKIGEIACGSSAVTEGFGLDCSWIIHTVSPMWIDGDHREEELLHRAYESALAAALEYHCKSVAFPLMAAGSYGFPPDLALSVAVHACNDFLLHHRMQIYLVVFHETAFQLSRQLVSDVKSYIDANYVEEKHREEYSRRRRRILSGFPEQMEAQISYAPMQCSGDLRTSLSAQLEEKTETFTECMLRIIREKDLLDPEVYGRILMDRKTFNKIKNTPDHHPKRKTAIQLAIALHLSFDEAREFIGKAGYAFSNSDKTDLILSFCIKMQKYDIDEIDALLVDFGEKALFTVR